MSYETFLLGFLQIYDMVQANETVIKLKEHSLHIRIKTCTFLFYIMYCLFCNILLRISQKTTNLQSQPSFFGVIEK